MPLDATAPSTIPVLGFGRFLSTPHHAFDIAPRWAPRLGPTTAARGMAWCRGQTHDQFRKPQGAA